MAASQLDRVLGETHGKRIGRAKRLSPLRAIYTALTGPPRYYVGSPWMNALGLQVGRVVVQNAAFRLRPRRDDPLVKQQLAEIEREGITVIPDFLPVDAYARVAAAFTRACASPDATVEPNWDDSGIEATTGMLTARDDDGAVVLEALSEDDRILKIVEGVMRRHARFPDHVAFQRLRLEAGGRDRGEPTNVLHADRHYPTVKAVLYLNQNSADTGAFVFARGTHRLTPARLWHEYRHSLTDSRLRASEGVDQLWYTGPTPQTPDIPEDARKAMSIREESIDGPPNTLVICNHAGFHRRGWMMPGHERHHLRLVFHFLEEPFYTPALRGAARALKSARR